MKLSEHRLIEARVSGPANMCKTMLDITLDLAPLQRRKVMRRNHPLAQPLRQLGLGPLALGAQDAQAILHRHRFRARRSPKASSLPNTTLR